MVRLGPDKPLKTYNIRLVTKTCSLVIINYFYEEEVFIKDEKTGERVRRVTKLIENDQLIVKCDNETDAQKLKEMLTQYIIK